MKGIRKVTTIAIVLVAGISALLILMSAINADRKSQQELRETDLFIAQYETPVAETETHKWVKVEAQNEESIKSNSTDTTGDGSRSIEPSDAGSEEGIHEASTEALVEDLAAEVIEKGINGPEREAYLGDRYKEVQAWIDANYEAPTYVYTEVGGEYYQPSGSGSVLNPSDGINYYGGILETYYNLDMSGVLDIMYSLGYSGEYWIRGDGVKMFGNYIMVAADFGWLPRGSIVETSLGTGIVCDTGAGGAAWLDIATTW